MFYSTVFRLFFLVSSIFLISCSPSTDQDFTPDNVDISQQAEIVDLADTDDATPPTVPGDFRIIGSPSISSVDLAWAESTDNISVSGYRIFRDDVLISSITTNSFSDVGLSENTTYQYMIEVFDAENNVARSNVLNVTTAVAVVIDTQSPTAPGNLLATNVTAEHLSMSWTPSTDNVGVSGYRIYRNGVLLNSTSLNSFTDATVNDNTSYQYQVVAYDAVNNTATSNVLNVTTPVAADTQSPTAPGNLISTDVTAEQVSMSWTHSVDNIAVSGYRIYRNGVLLNSTSLNSFIDTTVNDDTSYQYQVVAYDAANNAATSNVLNVTTPVAADTQSPTAPGNLVSTDVTAEQVSMSWTPSTDNIAVSGYRIYRNGVLLNSISLNSFTDATVNDDTSYQYQVVAYDAANNAATSNVLNVTTPVAADTQSPTAPVDLVSTDVTAEQVSMSWTPSTDNIAVSGYRIYRDGVLLNSTSLNSFTDASVNDDTSYHYQVEAYDGENNTATSNVLNVNTPMASDVIAPSNPGSLNLVSVTTSEVSFSWTASTDNTEVVGYRIYKNYSNTFFATTTSLTFTDTDLTPAQTYVYTVTAIDAAGNESSQSATISIDTKAVVATPSVSLSWQGPTQNTDDSCLDDVQGYVINYGTLSGDYSTTLNLDLSGGDVSCVQTDFDNVCSQPVMTCSYTMDSLDTGVWYFAVQAIDSLGVRSGYSNEGSKLVN